MAIFNVSNQLLQIDTGSTRTYLYNSTTAFAPWAGLGENQVLGQRYFGVTNVQVPNANSSPAIFMLVEYLSTSAITTANLTTAGGPAPVYWTDNTFTTVTGLYTEAFATGPLAFPAGYMMLNIISLTTLTAAQLVGAQIIIQIAGYLKGAYASNSSGTPGIGSTIIPYAGTIFQSANVGYGGTAPIYPEFGRQLTAISSGLCDVLVGTDII